MKSPEEWAGEIARRSVGGMLAETLLRTIREIQAEAQQAALALQPSLGELLVDDERAAQLDTLARQVTPGPWIGYLAYPGEESGSEMELRPGKDWLVQAQHNARLAASARQAIPDLLADRQTLLRQLNDLMQDGQTDIYRSGWNARVTYGPWTTLGELREGALFETRDQIRAVKSEYPYSFASVPDCGACQCVLLASGEYAHFRQRDSEAVREILIGWEEAK